MSIFGLGPLPKETTETPAAPAAAGDGSDLLGLIQKQSADRKAYFDRLTQQLKDRRYGPSASERLFAISAALAQPTRTPGFGGMLANVTPVFEQYAKDKRAAEAARASDMEKLGLARLNMGDDEVKTALELQRLRAQYAARMAAANKPVRGIAVGDRVVNPYTNEDIQPPIGTKRAFEGKTYSFLGGDQFDRKNWKEVF
jgi:hypothetical protein